MKDEIQRIKDRLSKERIIECEPMMIPKCWVCKDKGLVHYTKQIRDISYDFAYRCSCKKGQALSTHIPQVPEAFAQKTAIANYRYYAKEFGDELHLEYR